MRKNRARSWLLVGVLACSLAMTLSPWTAPRAHAQAANAKYTFLGDMDLLGYCRSLGYVSVTTIGNTYSSWRCVSSTGNDVQFSLQAACQWQYHSPFAWDVTDNFYRPTGGQCWGGSVRGGINLRSYCRSIGYQDVALLGNTAYDWSCVVRDIMTHYIPISHTSADAASIYDACQWMYPGRNTFERFADFYTPTSWQCIGNKREE